jgi:hypothetical protein
MAQHQAGTQQRAEHELQARRVGQQAVESRADGLACKTAHQHDRPGQRRHRQQPARPVAQREQQQQREGRQHQRRVLDPAGARAVNHGEGPSPGPAITFRVAVVVDDQHGGRGQAERRAGGQRHRVECARPAGNSCRRPRRRRKTATRTVRPGGSRRSAGAPAVGPAAEDGGDSDREDRPAALPREPSPGERLRRRRPAWRRAAPPPGLSQPSAVARRGPRRVPGSSAPRSKSTRRCAGWSLRGGAESG